MGLTDEITHGTGVPITKEFVVDMSNQLYRLDAGANPFLVFLNMFPKVTCYNYKYEWMEREGFSRRTFVAQWAFEENVGTALDDVLGVTLKGKDWDAIAFLSAAITLEADAEDYVRIIVTNQDGSVAVAGDVFAVCGYIKRSALENGKTRRKLDNVAGDAQSTDYYYNTIQLSKRCTTEADLNSVTNEAEVIVEDAETDWGAIGDVIIDGLADGAECYVTVEFPNQQVGGYKQGSGLGNESKKISVHKYNYTQIFKTPVSVTGTQQAMRMIGGDERMKRQFESGKSHASDLEYAMLFQGGGGESTDWGIMDNSENPRTKFKGLGVAHAADKEGWIVTNNGNPAAIGAIAGGDCQITTGENTDYVAFMERVFDDTQQGTPNKIMFCGIPFIKDLSILALKTDSPFTLNLEAPYAAAIGINVRRIVTPFGTLDMVLHPMFSGPYRRYGIVLDMANVALRPLNGRDTKLFTDVSSSEIDGITDEFRTEMGIEVRHEHTHAIAYLDGAV